MAKLSLNSISPSVFKVNASEVEDGSNTRATIVSAGRTLAYEHARKGQESLYRALNKSGEAATKMLSNEQYKELNERFQHEHLVYAATKVCEFTGESAPATFEDFKRVAMKFYGNSHFYAVLQGIYQEIITPILPRVYSEAVDVFADTVEVNFGETYAVSVNSNDVPVFQDSAWGASRSVPENTFYAKDYVLNPTPRTAEVSVKYMQLISNNMDFGAFFANLTAGMYAKTMGLFNTGMTALASNTTLLPSALKATFSSTNWVAIANKVAALNNTAIGNVIGIGSPVALAKVLPTQVTGSTNVNMDAAIAMLLGAEYMRAGYLGEYMSNRLFPIQDVIVPNTQNTSPTTLLSGSQVWMMASNGRKPMTIGYNAGTPITLEIDPMKAADFKMRMNVTMSIDSVLVVASKIGLITV